MLSIFSRAYSSFVHHLCLFWNQVVLLLLSFSSLYILDANDQTYDLPIFSPIWWVPILHCGQCLLLNEFLKCSRNMSFFCFMCLWCHIQETVVESNVIKLCSMFSSGSFIVLGVTFRSLIHFELVFVCGVRGGPNIILLHVDIQFSQHHLLKRPSFPHWIVLTPLSKIICPCTQEFIYRLSILVHWSVCSSLY